MCRSRAGARRPLTSLSLSLPPFPALLLVLSPRPQRTAALLCCSRYLRARPGLASRPRMLPGRPEPPPEPLAGCPRGQCVRGRLSLRGTWTRVRELSFRHGATWQVPRPGVASSCPRSLLSSLLLLSSLSVCGAPVS